MTQQRDSTEMQTRWNEAFTQKPDRFGVEASTSAQLALSALANTRDSDVTLLDLGSGEGRDSLFFAQRGVKVVSLDFSEIALDALTRKAQELGVSSSVKTVQHNVREPLPFADATFDACYSHMLYCMDFTVDELSRITNDIRRVLKPGGLQTYTARTTQDPDFGLGTHRGEQLYEDEGFIVHFFDAAMVQRLSDGFRVLSVTEFEEGALPRRLFAVIQEKI